MSDFDKLLWGFVFSGSGIVFGWTLNQLGQWFRGKLEDKKNLKLALFHLLETYFIFAKTDFNKIAKKIADKVHSKIPKKQQSEEANTFIRTLYLGVLTNYFKPGLLEDLKSVQANYQTALVTLAAIDPLTAYYLNGRSNIFELFDSLEEAIEGLKVQYPSEHSEIEKGTKLAMEIIRPDLFESTLSDLESDIRTVAWKVSPWTWYGSMKAIKRVKRNANQKLEKEVDKLFDKLNPLFES